MEKYAYTYDTPTEVGLYFLRTTTASSVRQIVEVYKTASGTLLVREYGSTNPNDFNLAYLPALNPGQYRLWCKINEPSGPWIGRPPVALPQWAVNAGIRQEDVLDAHASGYVHLMSIGDNQYNIDSVGNLITVSRHGWVSTYVCDAKAAYDLYLRTRELVNNGENQLW